MRIMLERGPYFTFVVRSEHGQTRLVQLDADFPGVAQTFGWSGRNDDSKEAIWRAYEFLEQHVGLAADDPGYF